MSRSPAGRFHPPVPEGLVYVEPFPRRVRGYRGDDAVIDSDHVLLVHRAGQPPTYAFPAGDVSPDLPAADVTADEDAPGHVRVPWDAMDSWYEEEEQVFGHPRNPYHRIDCVPTRRRLRVEVAGAVLVDTDATIGLYETSLAPKLYVERAQVRTDLLVPSATTTYCPYKGTASWFHAVVGEVTVDDVAWSYEDPLPESTPIRGLLSFEPLRTTLTHDLPTSA